MGGLIAASTSPTLQTVRSIPQQAAHLFLEGFAIVFDFLCADVAALGRDRRPFRRWSRIWQKWLRRRNCPRAAALYRRATRDRSARFSGCLRRLKNQRWTGECSRVCGASMNQCFLCGGRGVCRRFLSIRNHRQTGLIKRKAGPAARPYNTTRSASIRALRMSPWPENWSTTGCRWPHEYPAKPSGAR